MNAFATLLGEYFCEQCEPTGMESRHFRIAGHAVRIDFPGGRRLEEMTRALNHLASSVAADEVPELTISIWDATSAPRNHVLRAYLFTLKNWWHQYCGRRGELLDVDGGRLAATYHPGTGCMSVVDLECSRGFYWKSDSEPMPYYESCSPFRSLLHSWLRHRGTCFVHGAAVGFHSGGVMLVGKGGSGKSTSALACLRSPLQFAGDDYCIVRRNSSGGYDAHSLYSTAKLVEYGNLQAFPELRDVVINHARGTGEKVALSVFDRYPEKFIQSFPLKALLVPVITGRWNTELAPCSAHEAMMAIAPNTLSQLPSSGAADLRFLGDLVRGVACYRLLLGTDLVQIAERITSLLGAAGSGCEKREVAGAIPR